MYMSDDELIALCEKFPDVEITVAETVVTGYAPFEVQEEYENLFPGRLSVTAKELIPYIRGWGGDFARTVVREILLPKTQQK